MLDALPHSKTAYKFPETLNWLRKMKANGYCPTTFSFSLQHLIKGNKKGEVKFI